MLKEADANTYKQRLFSLLLRDAYRKEKVVLASGKESAYYIDARTVTLNPEGAFCVANIILSMVGGRAKEIKAIGGPTIGADPIVGAIAAVSFLKERAIKTFIVRKSAKSHGKKKQIEGPGIEPGSEVILVDDVATTGSSLLDSVNILRENSLKVNEAIVIVDREEGARENLQKLNIKLCSIFSIKELQEKA